MASKLNWSKSVRGWPSKFVYCHYEGRQIKARSEFFSDLDLVLKPNSLLAIDKSSPLHSEITRATAFGIDLEGKGVSRFRLHGAEKAIKHYFIEGQTQSGHCFTLEKLPTCILLQTCRQFEPEAEPIIRYQRDGKQRTKFETLYSMIEESQPAAMSIMDVLRWIVKKDEKGKSELTTPYHFTNSNCQHFAWHFWSKLSQEQFPDPDRSQAVVKRSGETFFSNEIQYDKPVSQRY